MRKKNTFTKPQKHKGSEKSATPLKNVNTDKPELIESKSNKDFSSELTENHTIYKFQPNEKKDKIHEIINNSINGLMLISTIIIAFYTYGLLIETKKTTKAAMDAVKEAATANKISENNYSLAKEIFEQSKIDGEESNKNTTLSISTQINTLKENKKQFDISNRPFLQVSDLIVDTLTEGTLNTSLRIINFGVQPAKLLSISSSTVLTDDANLQKNTNISLNKKSFNTVVPQHAFVPFTTNGQDNNITTEIIESVKSGKTYIYVFGECLYYNMITNEPRKYSFCRRLVFYPYYDVRHMIDNDLPIK